MFKNEAGNIEDETELTEAFPYRARSEFQRIVLRELKALRKMHEETRNILLELKERFLSVEMDNENEKE